MNWDRILAITLTCVMFDLERGSGHSTKGPTSDFEHFEVIHPKVLIEGTRTKRDLDASQRGQIKPNQIEIGFPAFGRTFHLELTKNEKLFSPHYREVYQGRGSRAKKTNMGRPENHCHYNGFVKDHENSWASINICHGLSGIVFDGKEFFHLHYYENASQIVNLVGRASNMKHGKFSCGNNDSNPERGFNDQHTLNRFPRSSEFRFPQSEKSTRYLELLVVADNSMFKKYGTTLSQRIGEIVNVVHGLYIQLSVFVVLVGIKFWDEKDEIRVSRNTSHTLKDFLKYREEQLSEDHGDSIHLITDIDFLGGTIGVAYKGTICRRNQAVGINQNHASPSSAVALVLAHEIGHNFNMSHDESGCQCPTEMCIMSASSSGGNEGWSSCSKTALSNYLSHGMDFCLKNIPTAVEPAVCGNGVLEPDEQCDCGPQFEIMPDVFQPCDNPCCNATTCQAFANAICASGTCCNLKTCKMKEVATPCREAQSECDLPEFCGGSSPFCPDDVFVQDGTECGNGKAFCFQGSCRSRDDQCRLLWGSDARSSTSWCYQWNKPKSQNGSKYCDKLQCSSTSSWTWELKFGRKAAQKSDLHKRNRDCTLHEPSSPCCVNIAIDFGPLTRDPGLVPNGAKCGENRTKMCLEKMCVPVEHVQKTQCPNKCSGNGRCNSNGKCHCIIGFGPPVCDAPGPGGSEDSNPESDPQSGSNYMVVMYVIFFFIYPLALAAAVIISIFHYRISKPAPKGKSKSKKPAVRKRSSFKNSLRRARLLSSQSKPEYILYDSFSSDEESSLPPSGRVLPDILKNPPGRVAHQTRNKPVGFPVGAGGASAPVAERNTSKASVKEIHTPPSAPSPLVKRNASRHSLRDGVILKVPTSQATCSKSVLNQSKDGERSADPKTRNSWHEREENPPRVTNLAKIFENM